MREVVTRVICCLVALGVVVAAFAITWLFQATVTNPAGTETALVYCIALSVIGFLAVKVLALAIGRPPRPLPLLVSSVGMLLAPVLVLVGYLTASFGGSRHTADAAAVFVIAAVLWVALPFMLAFITVREDD